MFGLSKQYFFRQLLFGMAIPIIGFSLNDYNSIALVIYCIISALLYPFSRFVYDSVMDFILGDTIIVFPIFMALFTKPFLMLFCFGLAPFIAPIGLTYLYYRNKKASQTS